MTNNDQKSFYQDASFNFQLLGGISSLAMILLSIYLTNHYFAVKFPTGLVGGGLCDINAFFNCDVATHSHLSNIAGVPISLLGLMMGLFVLFGFFVKGPRIEGTIHLLLWVNAAGCLVLFLYSLIGLGGLCPACTLYYVASFLTLFVFHKTSGHRQLALPVLGGYGLVFAVVFALSYSYVSGKVAATKEKKSKLASGLITQYENLPNLGAPDFSSEFVMAAPEGGFKEAPVRITKFSDFECPACRMLSEVLHKMAKKYEGKIAIQYFFYPLDNNCNPSMKRPLHQYACQAAYLAACAPEKFPEIEDKIFSNQESLSGDFLNDMAKEYGVAECMKKEKTKEKVLKYINAAKPFNVRSTPTFLLNGVKIEGVLPENQMSILIDHILEKK